ncbi:MAG TPA: carboxypeptidase-like regulatory domain-containing protein, partial [Longimicrobiales bacterium]|nr:carboxypeptidase-like regulatory domain-containing protein [Longimicrobiales bacterium]
MGAERGFSRTGDALQVVIRRMAGILAVAGLAAGLPLQSEAQTVEGEVQEASVRVLVRLLDEGGQAVASQVTDPAGRFLFAAPAGGRYRVRAERPGFQPREGPMVRVSAGARTAATVDFPDVRISLAAAPSPSPGQCRPVIGGRDRLSLAWGSVRTAADMAAWNARRGELRFDARIHRRQLEADGRTVLQADAPVERTGVTRLDAAVEPGDLFDNGFIREDADGGTRYFSPTPEVLADPDFSMRYCLRLQGPQGALLGLAFEPRSDEGSTEARPNVAGLVWLDAREGFPILLEFAYRNVDPMVVPASAGGTSTFTLLPDGSWVTAEASLRMPLLQVVDAREGRVWEVTGLREERARLIRVHGTDGTWSLTPRSGAVEGTVTFDEGTPLEGALVELVGTGRGTRSDADGRFRFDGLLDGVYRVAADHPRFDALPMGPGVPAVEVISGETATVVLAPPSAEEAALQLCPSDAGAGSVILTGQVVDSLSGEVLVGAPLTVPDPDPRREGTPDH